MPEDKGIMGSKVGDFKEEPKVADWRGDKGESGAKGAEETSSVEYSR